MHLNFLVFFSLIRIRMELNIVYRRPFVASFEFIDSTMTKEKNSIEYFQERKNRSINQPLLIIIKDVELTNFFSFYFCVVCFFFSTFLRKI